jgi:hypothetical protein
VGAGAGPPAARMGLAKGAPMLSLRPSPPP